MTISFSVNGVDHQVNEQLDMPLLWYLRDSINLKGTKFGCGIGQCGACTVHIDGQAKRSCITPVSLVANSRVTTIEGLSDNGEHPVQQAWQHRVLEPALQLFYHPSQANELLLF